MRQLSDNERQLIAQFAARLSDLERKQLIADATDATAHDVTPDGSRIGFEIAEYCRPSYRGQHSFGIDAKMLDRDGTELSVCLYADENGRLLELEFIRWDSNDLLSPRWETLSMP